MTTYRFELRKGGGKDYCPVCHQRRFVRYVDTWTGDEVANEVGRCDREDSCGYHLKPGEYFRNSGLRRMDVPRPAPKPEPEPWYIPYETMQSSLTGYDRNNFFHGICRVFSKTKALELTEAYRIGTSRHWSGACVFWQIDEAGRVRRGKVMLYDPDTGRRVKKPGNMIAGVHWLLDMGDRKPKACLFGLHLAAEDRLKLVAVVESEKSAIIGAGFVPEFIWMATGGKGNLSREILAPLRGRKVVLYPDLGAFDDWSNKVFGLPGVRVSNVLEHQASAEDRAKGLDVADFLLREYASIDGREHVGD